MRRADLKPRDLVEASKGRWNLSQQRISNWTRGENDPSDALLPWLCKVTGATKAELLGVTKIDESIKIPRRAFPSGMVDIPLVPATYEKGGDGLPLGTEETCSVPAFMADEFTFGFRIPDDSMYPLLQPGDLATFRHGELAKLRMVTLEAAEKQCIVRVMDHDGERFQLKPINSTYITLDSKDWSTLGIMTGLVREHGGGSLEVRYHPEGGRWAGSLW